ncbi:hypothetical protein RF11_13343 [Thelohanellus kitauei]|uniref:Uncharacterized protein n=1 Tax=Thelohanellus kitauei TaxID=669202 RepID=A0A0C2N0F5_THEKT|nr:hypothetical protein RF11_13343 [Thelohanellus kitauei]
MFKTSDGPVSADPEETIEGILKSHNARMGYTVQPRSITYLGYITPWNPDGSRWALENAHVFSLVSPVWLEAVGDSDFVVTSSFNFSTALETEEKIKREGKLWIRSIFEHFYDHSLVLVLVIPPITYTENGLALFDLVAPKRDFTPIRFQIFTIT